MVFKGWGTGVSRIAPVAFVSIARRRISGISLARRSGVSGVSRVAVVFVGRGSNRSRISPFALVSVIRWRLSGVPRITMVSIARGTGVTGSTGISWVSIPR